jgi:hypothetical protein
MPESFDQEVDPLERLEPGDGEDKRLIRIGPVVSLRRGRIQDFGRDISPAAEPLLDGPGLDEELPDVMLEKVGIDAMDQESPQAFFDFSFPAELRNQAVPEIIVFTHPMVEPTDMMRMADGIAGKTEGNHLVDWPAQPVHSDIGKTIGQVSPELLSKPVLGREDQVGIDPLLTESLNRVPGNRQVSPLDKRHIGCDDQNSFLSQLTFFKDLSQGFVGFFVVVRAKDEEGGAFSGRASITVIDIDYGIPKEGPDFRAGADAVADFHDHHFVGLDFVAQGTECGLGFFIVGRQEQKMSFILAGIGVEGSKVDSGVGQSPQDPAQDSGLIRGQDVEFGFNRHIMHFAFSFLRQAIIPKAGWEKQKKFSGPPHHPFREDR